MNVVSTGTKLCDKCGKPLGVLRVATWYGTFHQECAGFSAASTDTRDARIAELEARNRKLEEALRPFARYIAACEADTDKDEAPIKDRDLWVSAFDPVAMSMVELTYGDLFRARAALSTKEDGT